MVPTPSDPGEDAHLQDATPLTSSPPPSIVPARAQPLSAEAAWGMRALIMVLLFLLRGLGPGPTLRSSGHEADGDAPATDRQPLEPAGDTGSTARQERAARVARGAHHAGRPPRHELPIGDDAGAADHAGAAAARRRAVFASAVTAAGTAAWIAGRRSGRRP